MDLIEQFVEGTVHLRSPRAFRVWSAVGLLSAVLSRQVWTSVLPGEPLYANTNIMLVGGAASGKSMAIGSARKLLLNWGDRVTLAPDAITLEAMLKHAGQLFTEENRGVPASYVVLADELGAFFKEWKPFHFQTLAKLWDLDKPTFENFTKTQGKDWLHEHYIPILCGAQPKWLAGNLPENAFELGLPSRFLFIGADGEVKPGQEGPYVPDALDGLRTELAKLSFIQGFIPLTADAAAAFREWEIAGCPPAPTEPVLEHYAKRRNMHAGKLALIIALARHPGVREIRLADLTRAWDLLFEAETRMAATLSFAGGNPMRPLELQAADAVRKLYAQTQKAVHEREVARRLAPYMHPRDLPLVLNSIIAQELIRPLDPSAPPGQRLFKPGVV